VHSACPGHGTLTNVGTFRLATRGSPLALRQTESVAAALRASDPELEVEIVVVRTRGDEDASSPLDRIGGQGVFVGEVEAAVGDGRADAAVHSAKDVSSAMDERLVIAAVPTRADPRDGLVGCTLSDLPAGGVVGTGSARRRAQLAWLRPDLVFTDVRGNMARRVSIGESDDVHAVVVAVAAMSRLGWSERLADVLDPMVMLPQAGQGALAVQCRAGDDATRRALAPVDDPAAHRALRAERAVLAELGGSCTVPVAAWAETLTEPVGALRVHGLVASGDGRIVVRVHETGHEPDAVGTAVARALLVDGGGVSIDGFELA
jgi:hydroxymethylbilane synthase